MDPVEEHTIGTTGGVEESTTGLLNHEATNDSTDRQAVLSTQLPEHATTVEGEPESGATDSGRQDEKERNLSQTEEAPVSPRAEHDTRKCLCHVFRSSL